MSEITLKRAGEIIRQAKHIAISPHLNPDGDSLGSALGLYHALRTKIVDVRLFLDDDMPDNYHILPGWELFKKPVGEITDIDLLIVVDCDNERIGKTSSLIKAPILNLDHHRTNNQQATYLYNEPQCAATGEVIYQLLREMGINLNAQIATCLYTAIATDCGFFRYANTTAETMRIAADLLTAGAEAVSVSEAMMERSLEQLQILAEAIQTMEIRANGRLAVLTAPKEMLEKCHNTEDIVNYGRAVKGVDVSLFVKYVEPQLSRVSMRSRSLNVAEVAEKFGGGGHIHAAGITLKHDLGTTKQLLIDCLEKVLQEDKDDHGI